MEWTRARCLFNFTIIVQGNPLVSKSRSPSSPKSDTWEQRSLILNTESRGLVSPTPINWHHVILAVNPETFPATLNSFTRAEKMIPNHLKSAKFCSLLSAPQGRSSIAARPVSKLRITLLFGRQVVVTCKDNLFWIKVLLYRYEVYTHPPLITES